MWIRQFIAVKMKNWPRIRVLHPWISPETTFRFLGNFEFLFLFFISQLIFLRNMSTLRLNSGPRKETKYFAILRQITPDYASPLTKDGEKLRKIAQDGVYCKISPPLYWWREKRHSWIYVKCYAWIFSTIHRQAKRSKLQLVYYWVCCL